MIERLYVTIRFGGVDTPLIRIPVLDDEAARVHRISIAGHDFNTSPDIVLRPGDELVIRCERGEK